MIPKEVMPLIVLVSILGVIFTVCRTLRLRNKRRYDKFEINNAQTTRGDFLGLVRAYLGAIAGFIVMTVDIPLI